MLQKKFNDQTAKNRTNRIILKHFGQKSISIILKIWKMRLFGTSIAFDITELVYVIYTFYES